MTNDLNGNTQYEMVQLPSKGECYRNKVRQLPVAYLTASDEDVIYSNILRDRELICDYLLERKILDKSIHVGDLCVADREYLLLWLRRTGYGDTYTYTDEDGEEREIDLSAIAFKDFDKKGDEQGHFEITSPNGDIIKYRLLTHRDEMGISRFVEELDNSIISGTDMSEEEYYNKVAREILRHQVVSVNGKYKTDDWLNGLNHEELKSILEILRKESPGTNSETLNGLELNETIFYDLLGVELGYVIQTEEWT